MPAFRLRLLSVVVAFSTFCICACAALGAPGVARADDFTFGTPTELPSASGLPNYDDSSGEIPDGIATISCSSPGNCLALGDYPDDGLGNGGGDYIAEVKGVWGQWQTLPGAPHTNWGNPSFVALSCPADGTCMAIAYDYYNTCPQYPESPCDVSVTLEYTYAGGSFGAPTELTPPSDATSGTAVNVTGVACTSVSYCVAVGTYNNGGSYPDYTTASGSLGALGQFTSAESFAQFDPSVACPPGGETCVIAGATGTSGSEHPVVADDTNGSIGSATQVGPVLGTDSPAAVLLSCPALDACTALTKYMYSYYYTDFYSDTQNQDGSWGTPVSVNFTNGQAPGSLACTSAGNCVTWGNDSDLTPWVAWAQTEVSGTWGAEQDLPLPAGSNTWAVNAVVCAGGSCLLDGDNYNGAYVEQVSPPCNNDPSVTDGQWEFGGCFTQPDSDDYDTTQDSSLDGMTVAPSSSSDDVDYSDGGSSGDELTSSSATSLSMNLAPVSGGQIGLVSLTTQLQSLNLSGGPVTISLPSSLNLAGIKVAGSITFTPSGSGTAVGTVSGTLPGVLGGGTATVQVTTKFGSGVTKIVATANTASLGNVFGLSGLQMTYSGGTWTVNAAAVGAGGSQQTMNGTLTYNSAGNTTAGQLTISNVVIAGLLQVKTFKVSYSSSAGWSGAADLAQGTQAASVSLAINGSGVMTGGSIKASGIALWKVFQLKTFAMNYSAGAWGLDMAVDGPKGAPSVAAKLAVQNGTVQGADLDFKNVSLLRKVTVDDLHLIYTTPGGHDDFKGSTKVTLPGATVSEIDASFEMLDGTLKTASLDLYGNVPLYGALTLNHLGATIKLGPPKEIEGRVGLSAGPRVDGKELLGLDNGTINYTFPTTTGGSGTYTFSGDLGALATTIGHGEIVVTGGVAKLKFALGPGGKGFGFGSHLKITGQVTGGLRGTKFTAKGAAGFTFKFGSHTYNANGRVVISNNGITACAAVPALAKGDSGATYEWDGTTTIHKGNCNL